MNSCSWLTAKPLRLTGNIGRWLVRGSVAWLTFAPGSRPRRVSRRTLRWALNKVSANQRLNALARKWVNRFPRLKQRLKNLAHSQFATPGQPMRDIATANLTPRARQIYMDLNAAIEKKHQEGA